MAQPAYTPPPNIPELGPQIFTTPDGALVGVRIDIDYVYSTDRDSIGRYIRTTAARLARESISKYLGDNPELYIVKVDGIVNAPLFGRTGDDFPKLIEALPLSLGKAMIEDLRKAFNAIMNHLRAKVPSSFNPKNTRGIYQTSAGADTFFTILVGGRPTASINWEKISPKTNIQIYSKARHASPLESIKDGNLLAAAATMASQFKDVRVNFSYRDPVKFGQAKVYSKGGKQFAPLAVPVIEIGTQLSNVIADIRPVSRNLSLKKTSTKGAANLIYGRRILPESRKTNPRRYLTTRRSR